MHTPEHAQAVVEQLATNAVVQSQMNKARRVVGAPVVAPPKAAPALLRSMVAASQPAQLEQTPQLPAVPWSRTGDAAVQAKPIGLGIRPLDTGRLKMDGKVSPEALAQYLIAALGDNKHPTTMAVGLGKALTFGPPVFRDRMVSRYCELDYDDPREVWIKQEQQLKWVCAADNYGIGWADSGSTPWTYHERRLVLQPDGSYRDFLTPIISRVHWLYQRMSEWNCDLAMPKPSESQVSPDQVVWYCDPRTKLLRWRLMSETTRAGMRQLQRERRRRLAEALSVLSPTAPEAVLPEDPEDVIFGMRLLCMHRVAPQSWFNTALCIVAYRDDDIPEEDFVTHILNTNVAAHADILERQKVTRCGMYDLGFRTSSGDT